MSKLYLNDPSGYNVKMAEVSRHFSHKVEVNPPGSCPNRFTGIHAPHLCYNACAMTDKTEGLNQIASENFIEVNTLDAEKLGIEDREVIAVSSRRGEITAIAHVSDKTRPGETWMPFHFVNGANWITNDALDFISSTPEYKVCAVKIAKITE